MTFKQADMPMLKLRADGDEAAQNKRGRKAVRARKRARKRGHKQVGFFITGQLSHMLSVAFLAAFLCLLASFIFISKAEAKPLLVAFGYDKPPYVFAKTPTDMERAMGIEIDIVRETLALSGLEMTPGFVQKDHRDRFERGLQALKQSGRYQEIMDSYLTTG